MKNKSLNIKNPETYRLAKELSKVRGKSMAEVVQESLKFSLEMDKKKEKNLVNDLLSIGKRLSKLKCRDPRTADEILGYNEHGLPT